MQTRFTVFLLSLTWILASCGQRDLHSTKIEGKSAGRRSMHLTADMITYLQNQRLPSLKDAEPWDNGHGQGVKLTTEHYQIYTTLLEPLMLCEIPSFLESCYQNYQMQLPKPVNTTVKFTVYLFANRGEWENFTKTFAGQQAPMFSKIKAGAYYLNGSCIAYNIGRERTFSALGHECWHQFADRHFAFRLPSWLNEGMAMQFETARSEKGLFYFEPAENLYRVGTLQKSLEGKKNIPLKDLISMDPSLAIENGDYSVAAFYSQCYALIQFLQQPGGAGRPDSLKRMLADGLGGKWQLSDENKKIAADRTIPLTARWNETVGPELFRQYINADLDKTDKEFFDFCRSLIQK